MQRLQDLNKVGCCEKTKSEAKYPGVEVKNCIKFVPCWWVLEPRNSETTCKKSNNESNLRDSKEQEPSKENRVGE